MTSTTTHAIAVTALALTLSACGGSNAPDSTATSAQTPDTGTADTSLPLRPDRFPLIVGGTVVNHNKYQWMAALVEAGETNASRGQFCGGSLIASNWVLTAAHCVEDMRASDTDVLLGQKDLRNNSGERIAISRIVMHPDYNRQGYPDLALLELSESSGAAVISLPSFNNPAPRDGEISTVTGWGQVSENGPATDQLRESSMPIVDHNTCNRAYNNDIVEEAMVCAGTSSGDKDSCYGDSGGPLFVKRDNEYVQAGIVSFGEACGLAGVPGVYARVSSYYDWISAYAPVKAYGSSDNSGDSESTGNPDNESTPVDATDNNTPSPDDQWQFTGTIDGWFDEAYLPDDETAIAMSAGLLTVKISTDSEDPMVLFVDEYDPEWDEWYTVTGEVTRSGVLEIDIDIEAGEYAFSVISLGDGGDFTLNAVLEP